MAEPTEPAKSPEEKHHSIARGPQQGTPRWVKGFMIAAAVLVAIFVIVHLAGGGMGSHTP